MQSQKVRFLFAFCLDNRAGLLLFDLAGDKIKTLQNNILLAVS